MFTNDESSDTTEFADDVSEDNSEIDQKEADSEDNEYHREHPIFKKCISFKKKHSRDDSKVSHPFTGLSQSTASLASQTDIEASDIDSLFEQIVSLEKRNDQLLIEFKQVATENFDLKAKNTEYIPFKGKVRQLETQNSVLKEKTIDARKENDMLVEKIQTLQKRLSCEQQVRVSVSEYPDDDLCFVEKCPEIDSPGESLMTPGMMMMRTRDGAVTPTPGSSAPRSPRLSRAASFQEEFQRSEERGFQEAAEKIMRLEQRIVTLQNANQLNSCASCGPLRSHVMKIEKQIVSMVRERKGQLEELFELKQEALSSAVSEKDAHLAWLEATSEGNIHTRSTIDRLRKERRDLLLRMKEENENRGKLMSELEESTCAMFTGTIKISTLGSFGEYCNGDDDDDGIAGPMTEYTSEDNDEDDLPAFHPGRSYSQPPEPGSSLEADTASVKSC